MKYREATLLYWKECLQDARIEFSSKYSIQLILSDPLTISRWTSHEKLPNDAFSIENAIILKNSPRWPLMIDP